MQAEQFERKAKQLDAEKAELERKLDDMTQKYTSVKAELQTTLQGLEDL